MIMKKTGLVVVSILVLVGLVLVGFSSVGQTAEETTYISIATGGTSGTYYPIGGALAKVINENVANANASAQSTGASVTNTRLIAHQKVELAILQNDIASYAVNGENQFSEAPVTNMKGIATLYPEIIQIVVREDANISSIKDLKGKKVAVGAPGSGVEANASQILKFFGLTYDDIEEDFLSFGEAASRLKDRQIDAAFLTAGIPTAAVMDVAATQDINLLNFTDEEIESLNKKHPFLTGVVVPAGTYNGVDNSVKTIALKATLVVEASLSEELVYNITKAIFENRDTLIAAHARARDIKVETAQDGMTVELHSGAQKYFDEVQ